ncbi:hypothetical protein Taro_048802 [Colocasia esculenta]|uniref:Cytochrome P450 n=1 Tax=Colocasia esculenta TaxID=4460 RepID=A0A843X992_COLES|nr:hypothetical protein [Colocasia esculenta]
MKDPTFPQPTAAPMDLLLTCQCLSGLLALVLLAGSLWLPRPRDGGKKGEEPRMPPEPAGAWPVVGHFPLLMRGKEIAARTLGRMADKYGPVFMLRLGAHRTLVISSQEAARDCFTTWDRVFATRPRSTAGKHLAYDHSMIGFAPYGPTWREMRKMATVELLSPGRLEKLRHVRATEVDMRISELHQLCEDGGGRPKVVDMGRWFMDTTFNIIVRMVVGKRYSSGGGEGEQMRRFQKVLAELLYLMGMFVPSDAVPWLEWLDLQGYIKAMKKTFKELDAVLVTWIEEHRKKRREKPDKDKSDQDFIDVMLSAMEGLDLAGLDPNTLIKATSGAIVIAGTDTSAGTMTWALALLLNHRRVLDKVRQEIDLHVGAARNVEEKDIPNLVYLHAVVKETTRLYPVAPLSLPHEATADCRVGGYHVPAGTRLLTNLWRLHRDPRVWGPDTEEFRPERFLDGEEVAGVDVRGKQFQFLPFGSGRRMCPGLTLALQTMQLTLARLIHGFELGTAGGAPVDMGEGLGVTLNKAAPLEVLITPRLPLHLYHHQ